MDEEKNLGNPEITSAMADRAAEKGNDLESTFISATTGARIRKAREDKGLTQGELANRINASQAQIEHYERGGLDMPMARLFDMAEVLEVTAADLLVD
jgi:ribosome-binding protein aMBF1 (putative translation factor)